MAISTRELYLILRARDEASRVLRSMAGNITGMGAASQAAAQRHIAQGQALVTVGAGIAFAGAAALKFFNDSTNAAAEYNQEAAKTLTQVDQTGVKLEDIKRIGIDVAKAIPAPFEEMQTALYDIFSSMDVSVKEAEVLLTAFSKAAVAGQTDLQTAARGTITIMNAWKLPATEVNRVNDVMFQLVRKGVGTYQDFSRAIGRSIPSAVRAGQSIEDLAGMMAFMTRNGLSSQMAATSAGRAFDAMAHPSTIKKMEAFGISIKDANGEFRPMVDIVGQLSRKMADMTAPEKARALQELFKGSGGTIQARRFFDLAINNFDELAQRTREMHNSAGVADQAYKIMFDQPQTEMQAFNNQLGIMKVSIGDALLPLKEGLLGVLTELLAMWNSLSPKTQEIIVKFAAFAAAAAVVVGIVTAVVGGILLLVGAAALAGVSIGVVAAIIAGIVFTIGLWVAAIIGIIKYHEEIQDVASKVWSAIAGYIEPVWDWLQKLWAEIVQVLLPAFQQFWTSVTNGATAATQAIQRGLEYLRGAFQDMQTIADQIHLDDFFRGLALVVSTVFHVAIMNAVYAFRLLVDIIGGIVGPAIQMIGEVFEAVAQMIAGAIRLVAGLLSGDWAKAWEGAKMIAEGFKKAVEAYFRALLTILFNIVSSIAQGIWDRFNGMARRVLSLITTWGSNIVSFFRALPGRLIAAGMALGTMLGTWMNNAMQRAKNALVSRAKDVVSYAHTIPGRIRSALGNLGGLLYNAGRDILSGLINGIRSRIGEIRSTLGSITGMIPDWKGPKEKDLKLLEPTGGWLMQGLIEGWRKDIPELRRILNSTTDEISNAGSNQRVRRPALTPEPVRPMSDSAKQIFNIYTQEIDPRQHAAELGYEVAKRVSH